MFPTTAVFFLVSSSLPLVRSAQIARGYAKNSSLVRDPRHNPPNPWGNPKCPSCTYNCVADPLFAALNAILFGQADDNPQFWFTFGWGTITVMDNFLAQHGIPRWEEERANLGTDENVAVWNRLINAGEETERLIGQLWMLRTTLANNLRHIQCTHNFQPPAEYMDADQMTTMDTRGDGRDDRGPDEASPAKARCVLAPLPEYMQQD